MQQTPTTSDIFFLPTPRGRRLCVLRKQRPFNECRGAILMVPAFAEEMNKSRRMLALHAQSLASCGYAVLSIDLCGTGDSQGSLAETIWQDWHDDLACACEWLCSQMPAPIHLLGLRLGALLALDFACQNASTIKQLVLWQPVTNGRAYMKQFFRLQLANNALSGAPTENNIDAIKSTKANIQSDFEVAGYELSSRFRESVEAIDLLHFPAKDLAITWLELSDRPSFELTPARQKYADFLCSAYPNAKIQKVSSMEFWETPSISTSAGLIELTTRIFNDGI